MIDAEIGGRETARVDEALTGALVPRADRREISEVGACVDRKELGVFVYGDRRCR